MIDSVSDTMASTSTRWTIKSMKYIVPNFKDNVRRTVQRGLFRAAMALSEKSNVEQFAKSELKILGFDNTDDMDNLMASNVIDLCRVFSMQGHSGFSAPFAINLTSKLCRFTPLSNLTGEGSEWMEVGDGVFQNKRMGSVFKQADRFDGRAYFLDGKVFRTPDGACYTNSESMTPITFPCIPTSTYIDVAE